MERIGKAWILAFLVGLVLNSFAIEAAAQNNITVEATVSKATVYEGGRIKLNITISGDFNKISLPELPDIPNFRLISQTPSTSRRFSYVNGVSKTSYTYSYFFAAQKEGIYTIPPVSVQIDAEKYLTKPIQVEVAERSDDITDAGGADIYLELEIADQTVVPGEQIIANIVLYFKDGIKVRTYQPIPGWKAEGFWKEQLNSSTRPEVKSLTLNGVRYNKARLLRFSLFPTKTGELTISPYHVNVLVFSAPSKSNPFSSFFGNFGTQRRQLELATDPVTIDVTPLPADSSSNYIGAVGSFAIERKISADTVKVGETVEITTIISGTGNIPLLTKPEYKLPADLEVYQPQSKVEINRNGARIKGSKTFTDVVVPRNAGRITIPAVTIAWYNPAKGAFVEQKLEGKTIFVNASGFANTGGASNRNGVAISPITGLVNWATPKQESLISYWWFWVGILLPVAGFVFAYLRRTYSEKMSADYHFARSQQAFDVAKTRLREAIDHAENNRLKQAYNSLQKALTGFIADKLGMPEAGTSIEQYVEALEKRGVNKDLIKNVRMLLNKSATINYAPDSSTDYLKSHAGLAESIIKKLKKEL